MSFQLASFPNSRIKPRPVRTQGDTQIQTLAAGPLVTQILPANLNRVNALIRNLDSSNNLYYGYDNAIDGSVGPQGGFLLSPLQTVSIDDPRAIYIFNGNGVPVNICIDEGEG
jgi:hypothetical protein